MSGSYSGSKSQIAPKLVFSYFFDWLVLIVVAVVATVLGKLDPNKRPFSLTNPDISFPFTQHETVPLSLLLILCAAVPFVAIPIVVLVLVPGRAATRNLTRRQLWMQKLWEIHVGWLGLAASLVATWFFTQSMKNMFGKPRPDLLARCDPDIANMSKYVVGGYENGSLSGQLVSASICRQTDSAKLNDGFCSFPSGHSSASASTLVYLTMFLASKLRVAFPIHTPVERAGSNLEAGSRSASEQPTSAAASPIYLLLLTLVPFCLAVFIDASRWFDFRHHGFDILFGSLMGTATSIYSFRTYHMPISSGGGWAWGPRSLTRAFWAGVGVTGYVAHDADHKPTHEDVSQPLDTSYQSQYQTQPPPHFNNDIEMHGMQNTYSR